MLAKRWCAKKNGNSFYCERNPAKKQDMKLDLDNFAQLGLKENLLSKHNK